MREKDTDLLEEAYDKVVTSEKFNGRVETLHAAIDYIESQIAANGILPAEDWKDKFSYGGISYGDTKNSDFEIETIKGKKTRKYGHVTITRTDGGVYEPIFYVL